MNMTEMTLIQMRYPMVDFSMPKPAPGEGRDAAAPDFQNLMERKRKADASAQEPASRKKETAQSKDAPAPKEDAPPREEETVSPESLTGLPFAVPAELLIRPEIHPVPEDLSGIAALGLTAEGAAEVVTASETPAWTPDSEAAPARGEARTAEESPDFVRSLAGERADRAGAVESAETGARGTAAPNADTPVRERGREDGEQEMDSVLPEGTETAPQPLFREVESTPVKVGESYRLDAEAGDMEVKLADTVRAGLEAGARRIEIRLTPEHLGTLTIRLTQSSDGALQVVLHTADAKAGDLLTRHLDGLHMALQGVSQGEVQVEVQRNQDSAPAQQQYQADPDGRGRQQQQQHRQERQAKTEDFLHQLRLGLLPLEDAI